jgi:hypothetical protein
MVSAESHIYTKKMSRIAVVIDNTNPPRVVTWIRGDTPGDWPPPDGTHLVREDEMPAGWTMVEPQPLPVPEDITPWQLRTWLLQRRGVTPDQVLSVLSAISDPIARAQAMIDWDYPSEIRRDHHLIETLGTALGLASAEVDQAFREAATLA